MIPEFPQFKKLEIGDKEDVEKLTFTFPPYSDFNFVSLWSWNIIDEMRLSVLNGNLVIHFTNYLTGTLFYSFLGKNKVNETAASLIELSKKESIEPKLFLMPEDVVVNLDKTKFKIVEDPDNFDYISDINLISEYKGEKFAGKRKKYSSFIKNYPNVRVEILDLKNFVTERDVLKLDEEWLKNKLKKNINYKFNKNELVAMDRFFKSEMTDMVGVGIYDGQKLIYYSFFEILPSGYSINHFAKADTHYEGIYDYAEKENAKILNNRGSSFLNYEQDLGIPGLRESKKTFMLKFLLKFTVTFAD